MNKFKNKMSLFHFLLHSPIKYLQNDIRVVRIGRKRTALHPFEVDKVSKDHFKKN